MNDKDKEAFEKWWHREANHSTVRPSETWQAACDYKRDEYSSIMQAMTQTSQNNFKLQAENDILSGEIFTYKKISDDAFKKLAVAVEALDYYATSTLHELASTAREVLKEISGGGK